MLFARIVLIAFGLSFLLFGAWALVSPTSMAKVIHFNIDAPMARTEFRAFYGGVEIALAILFITACFMPTMIAPALWVLLVSCVCIGSSRLIGMSLDQVGGTFLWIALAWEWGAAALSAIALWLLKN